MKLTTLRALLIAFCSFGLALSVQAQSAESIAYRLDFTLHEYQNGKQVSVRNYSMVLSSRNHESTSGRIRIGGRVPVKTEGSSSQGADKDTTDRYTYQDIGFSLDCAISQAQIPDRLPLTVTAVVTSIVPPSQPPLPIFRTASTSVQVNIPVGKRLSIAKLEDLTSDDTYELEVEATPADAASNASVH